MLLEITTTARLRTSTQCNEHIAMKSCFDLESRFVDP